MPRDNNTHDASELYGTLAPGPEFYRRVGARLTEPISPDAMEHFERGFTQTAHRAFHAFDKAHLVMLAEENIIPLNKAATNLEQLQTMEENDAIAIREESNRHCHAGEAYLIEHLGEATGGWIHIGRSTGDFMGVARRFQARELILTLLEECLDLMADYCDAADQFTHAIMPNYTIFQQAQVGTFGWYLTAWERPIERCVARLIDMYPRVNQSPAGLAAGTTTDFPINRERTAELLGFNGILDNAEDGLHMDFDCWLTLHALATTLSTVIAIAADHVFLWNTREFNLVDLPDRFFGTSSIMPHKRNAYVLQEVQKDTSPIIGALQTAYVQSRNLSSNPGVPVSTVNAVVSQIRTWRSILTNLEFNDELGKERVYLDWALSADLAAAIVREKELPWRSAHQIIAILVRQSIENDRDIRELTTEHIDDAATTYLGEPIELDQATIDTTIDPARALTARQHLTGSPAPEQVENQLARSRERISRWRSDLTDYRSRLEHAEKDLKTAVDNVISANETA